MEKTIKNEKNFSLCVRYPQLTGKGEKITAFYQQMADAYEIFLTEQYGCKVAEKKQGRFVRNRAVFQFFVLYESASFLSGYIEVQFFQDGVLTLLKRYAQTWDLDLCCIVPLPYLIKCDKKLKQKNPHYAAMDFYLTKGTLCFFHNPEQATSPPLRRSAYDSYFSVIPIAWNEVCSEKVFKMNLENT